MKTAPHWISKQAVIAIHGMLLAAHGGLPGLLDDGLLESALASPKNRLAYERPDFLRLAAAYAFAITRNHPFADGNKRVALTVAGVFLEMNGFRFEASELDAAQATRALAAGEMSEAQFAAWLKTCTAKHRPTRPPATRKPLARRRKPRQR